MINKLYFSAELLEVAYTCLKRERLLNTNVYNHKKLLCRLGWTDQTHHNFGVLQIIEAWNSGEIMLSQSISYNSYLSEVTDPNASGKYMDIEETWGNL